MVVHRESLTLRDAKPTIEEGLEVIDGFYGAYADRTPSQDSIRLLGNDYLRRAYPQLDSIIGTRVTGYWGQPGAR